MTQAQFDKIKAEFEKENERYAALVPGQRIYTCTGFDNFEHEVIEVDIPNRIIHIYDHSLKGIRTTITHRGWHLRPQPTM